MNNKIITYGNIENLYQANCIYISNHYDGLDLHVLVEVISRPGLNSIYTIAKSDIVLSYKYGKLGDIVNTTFLNALNLIPYYRGNKESGVNILKQVEEKFNKNKKASLLIFPEGGINKYGISVNFKPGIFKFAEQHNIPIIPITIHYNPYTGENKKTHGNLMLWLNNDVKVFIHDKILPQDYNIMLKQSFDVISSTHSKMREMN